MVVAKFDGVHKNRIFSHIYDDATASKTIFSATLKREILLYTGLSSNKLSIEGLIHELGMDPFGFIIISQFQVYFKLYELDD